jgi:cellulose biosynthesis protein BcsQ
MLAWTMQVIIINSQKGGSAKTMLAKHLSVEAERAGMDRYSWSTRTPRAV